MDEVKAALSERGLTWSRQAWWVRGTPAYQVQVVVSWDVWEPFGKEVMKPGSYRYIQATLRPADAKSTGIYVEQC